MTYFGERTQLTVYELAELLDFDYLEKQGRLFGFDLPSTFPDDTARRISQNLFKIAQAEEKENGLTTTPPATFTKKYECDYAENTLTLADAYTWLKNENLPVPAMVMLELRERIQKMENETKHTTSPVERPPYSTPLMQLFYAAVEHFYGSAQTAPTKEPFISWLEKHAAQFEVEKSELSGNLTGAMLAMANPATRKRGGRPKRV